MRPHSSRGRSSTPSLKTMTSKRQTYAHPSHEDDDIFRLAIQCLGTGHTLQGNNSIVAFVHAMNTYINLWRRVRQYFRIS